ncbi:MAG TPA: 4-(cytidine 5'-diphospho)-2-C-methyl-D-erythritol kinase [Actinobacteria bacterium]|nr:4-(cytidine 5'-diphospho)-2-C-methyl-D-erythritol kinase [Actinomycetota bacterium]
MKTLELRAHAKINLYLDVLGKRGDGYHDIQSVMQSLELADEISLSEESMDIGVVCSFPLPREENLVWKAAKLLRDEVGVERGALIEITKHIPVAAGLAGGSADVAAVLMGLNLLWDLDLSHDRLLDLGERIGADVPFCLKGGTCLMEGKGERVTSVASLPHVWVVVAKPDFEVSTGWAYDRLDRMGISSLLSISEMLAALERGDLREISSLLANIFERVMIEEHPEIESLKKKSIEAGALGALMSGSGPSVFALFEGRKEAEKAARLLEHLCSTVIVTTTYPCGWDILC